MQSCLLFIIIEGGKTSEKDGEATSGETAFREGETTPTGEGGSQEEAGGGGHPDVNPEGGVKPRPQPAYAPRGGSPEAGEAVGCRGFQSAGD